MVANEALSNDITVRRASLVTTPLSITIKGLCDSLILEVKLIWFNTGLTNKRPARSRLRPYIRGETCAVGEKEVKYSWNEEVVIS
jgi:hypothetical protein